MPAPIATNVGDVFGDLVVVDGVPARRMKSGERLALLRCACGATVRRRPKQLRRSEALGCRSSCDSCQSANQRTMRKAMTRPLQVAAEAFWSRVHVGSPDVCWPWIGKLHRSGYAYYSPIDGIRKAHRIAYRLSYAPPDRNLMVLHSCDHPPCCNPYHLRLGTAADNAADMVSRGRGRGQFPKGNSLQVPR